MTGYYNIVIHHIAFGTGRGIGGLVIHFGVINLEVLGKIHLRCLHEFHIALAADNQAKRSGVIGVYVFRSQLA